MKKIFTLQVDKEKLTLTESIRPLTDDTLQTLYNTINCDCVSCYGIELNGKPYSVWYDDEFLCKYNPIPTLLIGDENSNNHVLICGSYVISGYNPEDGATIGIDENDMHTVLLFCRNGFEKIKTAYLKGTL